MISADFWPNFTRRCETIYHSAKPVVSGRITLILWWNIFGNWEHYVPVVPGKGKLPGSAIRLTWSKKRWMTDYMGSYLKQSFTVMSIREIFGLGIRA